MAQTPVPCCDCCGLLISQQAGEDCPRCTYPISLPKEEQFLESSIRDLRRIVVHGGANLTVAGLLYRYQRRLDYLRHLMATAAPVHPPAIPVVQPAEKLSEIVPLPSSYKPDVSLPYIPYAGVVPPVAPVEKPPEVVPPLPSATPVEKSPERAVPRPPVAPVAWPAMVAPTRQPEPAVPVKPPAPAAPVRQSPSIREVVFSLGAFFVDHAITVIGLLGAFLILLGTLSFVYNNVTAQSSNRLGSFLVVFGAHAVFGILGVIAYRFANFRLIARIYIIIYALLLPLAALTGYGLIQGNSIPLTIPVLIAIAAAYATIVYAVLAIYQGSAPFGYLAAVALAVVDLAIARVFGLDYQWWPGTLMILALPALVTVARSSGGSIGERVFAGRLSVLRDPIRMLMFILVGVCALGILLTASYSFILGSFGGPVGEIRFSILSMTLLLLLWTSLYMWLTRRTKQMLVLASLFLACVLAFCYAFNFEHIGYALALTGAALLYHGLNRFAGRLLQPFGTLGLRLDQLALVLVALVPLISAPRLPLQLLATVYHPSASSSFPLYVQTTWEIVGTLLAIGAGLLLTLSVAFNRACLQSTSGTQRNAWPWLLLLSGVLLNWEYSEVVVALHTLPVWCFLGLTLALVVGAVVVRQRFGSYWANLLDVLTLAEALLTLSLNLDRPDSLWSLLLLFAALSYGVLLYQRRQKMLILPLVFALFALPVLVFTPRLQVVLLLGIVLPFAAVAVRRLIPANLISLGSADLTNWRVTIGWEWPLLTIALLSGIIVSGFDLISSGSTVHTWVHVPFPVALELATFSLAWYVSAALARVKWWLLPVIGFASAALLLPFNPFWVLFGVTMVSAALSLGIRRLAGRDWAWPFSIVTLLAAMMTGVAGHTPHLLLATTWVLLAFAVLFYIMGIVEDWTPWLWIMPVFAIWSLIDSAALLGDLFRPPTLVLVCAAAGVAIGLFNLFARRRNSFIRYVLPFYATALVAAVLTGVYGTLGGVSGVNNPFPGAVPVALLVYAMIAYGVLLFERRPLWLGLAAGFAIWGTLLATQTASYAVLGIKMMPAYAVLAIGMVVGIAGLLLSRLVKLPSLHTVVSVSGYDLVKFSWGWPWYATALVAAVVTGVFASLPVAAWALLIFAVLFYIIGVVEDQVSWLWLVPALVTWSRIDALRGNDLYGLFAVTLVSVALGVGVGILKRFVPVFSGSAREHRLLRYALPFYVTALASAVLTGIDVTFSNIHPPFDGAFPAVLLLYAAVAYGVLLFERRPWWLGLVAGFAIWGTVLALQTTIYYVVGIGVVAGIAGLLLGRVRRQAPSSTVTPPFMQSLVKLTWGWPWYATALVAAIVTGLWSSPPLVQPVPGFIAYDLLGFAVLFYIIGVVEDQVSWLWVAPALATWSLIDSALQPDFSRLPTVALTCAVVGVAMSSLTRFVPRFRDSALGNRLPRYTLPFYAVALVAAVLTGIDGMHFGLNQPFYGVALVPGTVPVALLLYAVVAYGVLLFERRPGWLWLVAGFAIWGMLLVLLASPMLYYVVGIGIGAGLVGLLIGLIARRAEVNVATPMSIQILARFTWSWPWYLTTLVAAAVTSVWSSFPFDQPAAGFVMYSLFAFAALTVVMMLVERLPEALVFPLVLAAVAIGQTHWGVWQLMAAYSLLCVLIFASQFIWKLIPPATNWLPATLLHRIFGLGGQALVVLTSILLGGLSANAGSLAHAGAGTLFVLALLLCWYGRLQHTVTVQRWSYYSAGLLLSLVVPWELLAFKQTNLDLLTLAPASYLVVIGPFLIREEALPHHQRIGQAVSMLGAALLLLPTLWLSFSSGDGNVLYTLILLGESLVLLVLGLGLRVRILILCGAGLIVVGALHALFLSTPSIPLALAGLGVILLLVATGLTLARHRLRGAWARWQ